MPTNEEVLQKQDRKCAICGRPLTDESYEFDDKMGTYHMFGTGDNRVAICNKCFVHQHENEEYPMDLQRNKPIKYKRNLALSIVLTLLFGWIGMLYTNPRKSGSLLLFSAVSGIVIGFIGVIFLYTTGYAGLWLALIIMLIVFLVLYYVQAIIMCIRECKRMNGIWNVFFTDAKSVETQDIKRKEVDGSTV